MGEKVGVGYDPSGASGELAGIRRRTKAVAVSDLPLGVNLGESGKNQEIKIQGLEAISPMTKISEAGSTEVVGAEAMTPASRMGLK